MTTPENIANPGMVETSLYDATGHQSDVAWQAGTVVTDGITGRQTAPGLIQLAPNQSVNIQHGNVVDAQNSSTTTLTGNAIFTGVAQSSLNYSAVAIEAFTDQAGTFQLLQSQDNVNYDLTDTFSVAANTAFNQIFNLVGQYYKVKYTNGSVAQTVFRLQTIKQAVENVMPRTLTSGGNLRSSNQNEAWTSVYSTTQTGVSTWTGSGDIASLGQYSQLLINYNVSALTGTSIQFKVARKDSFGNWINILTGATISAVANQAASIGGGGASSPHFFGTDIQITAILTSITSVTFTVDVQAR